MGTLYGELAQRLETEGKYLEAADIHAQLLHILEVVMPLNEVHSVHLNCRLRCLWHAHGPSAPATLAARAASATAAKCIWGADEKLWRQMALADGVPEAALAVLRTKQQLRLPRRP